jgi:hypothetical protein
MYFVFFYLGEGIQLLNVGTSFQLRIILKLIFDKYGVTMWIGFACFRMGQWRALENTVMNLRVP